MSIWGKIAGTLGKFVARTLQWFGEKAVSVGERIEKYSETIRQVSKQIERRTLEEIQREAEKSISIQSKLQDYSRRRVLPEQLHETAYTQIPRKYRYVAKANVFDRNIKASRTIWIQVDSDRRLTLEEVMKEAREAALRTATEAGSAWGIEDVQVHRALRRG